MSRIFVLILSFVILNISMVQPSHAQIPKREHVNLQYDKPNGCYLGDTVHFVVSLDKETAKSKVVYVELLHPTGSVITSLKLKLDSLFSARGEIKVDTLYGSGFYELRAFTRFQSNWFRSKSTAYLLPVFLPASKAGKEEKPGERYISKKIYRNGKMCDISKLSKGNTYDSTKVLFLDTAFHLRQPVEDQLIVFGRITPKFRSRFSMPDSLIADRKFNVRVARGNKSFGGQVTTDENGHFAIYLPDTLTGIWNLIMYEKTSDVKGVFTTEALTKFRVNYLENFVPRPKLFQKKEFDAENFGYRKWRDDEKQSKTKSMFYNCDDVAIDVRNQGSIALSVYSWLGDMDKGFTRTKGIASPSVMNVAPDSTYSRFLDLNFPNNTNSDDPRTVCVNGPGYDGHPIIWIINGEYRMVTGLNSRITDFRVLRPSCRHMPQYLDEVHTVYITDAPDAAYSYVRCSVLESKKPITIFITTHNGYYWNDSALMTSHFRGYDN